MPNHIINTIRLTGDREKISELLESVKDNRFGIGSLDFNKVIPMPESLQIETSSSMERGLKAYKEFVDICTFDGANKDMDLLNIPDDKENIFLRRFRYTVAFDKFEVWQNCVESHLCVLRRRFNTGGNGLPGRLLLQLTNLLARETFKTNRREFHLIG